MDPIAALPSHPTERPTPAPVILVVDDDPAVRQVAARVLQRVGYHVLQAGEGAEALEVARSFPGTLDLLLTDVVMPGMNGRELGERMAAERPDTRLLYMSAYTADEIIVRGVRVAEVAFLHKPFSLDGLTAAVRNVLSV
jgi:two-component system cell cycle sensor histidine kinase/response regulator CckA